jgi:polyisoprenoid-binding protein YceI
MLDLSSRSVRVAALVLCLAPATAPAQWQTLELDAARSRVDMTFHATMHDVEGTLGPASGRIEFDLATREARGEVVVELTEADTEVRRRDRKMHEKILETERYPRAIFRVERVSGVSELRDGANDLQLDGALELHGVSKPVTVLAHAEVRGAAVDATASARIPYLDWGVRDPSFFVIRVAKEVTVRIQAAGILRPSAR